MSLHSNRKLAIKKLQTLVLHKKMDMEAFRTTLEETFCTIFIPNNVERNELSYVGNSDNKIKCDILVPELYSTNKILVYVHGGSFCGGTLDAYRNFCSSLAHTCQTKTIVPEYRLAPAHPFPSAIDDVLTVMQTYCDQKRIENPQEDVQIILAADGSGASIAIATLLKMSDLFRKNIKSVVLFSPWLDMASDAALIKEKRVHDEVLYGADLHRAVDLYTYASNFNNPLVSPLKASSQDLQNFPKFYIQMGKKELLLSQAQQFKQKLEEANVTVTLDAWDNMMYMFQMADEHLEESHLAIEKLGSYIREQN